MVFLLQGFHAARDLIGMEGMKVPYIATSLPGIQQFFQYKTQTCTFRVGEVCVIVKE
jgi:hypothetical protein